MRKIPKKYFHALFSLCLSGTMSLIVTTVHTIHQYGLTYKALTLAVTSWPLSWMIAFPVAFIIGPSIRKLLSRIIES